MEETLGNSPLSLNDNIQKSFNIQLNSKTGVTMETKSISVSTLFHHCLNHRVSTLWSQPNICIGKHNTYNSIEGRDFIFYNLLSNLTGVSETILLNRARALIHLRKVSKMIDDKVNH